MRSDRDARQSTGGVILTADPVRNELRVIFPSAALAVREALITTMDGLRGLNLTDDDRSSVELVLAEVLNNIVEHSYAEQPDGLVELHIVHDAEELTCTALDAGKPMPGLELPQTDPPDPEVSLLTLAEGGFGWFLIRELSTDLVYRRQDGRNRLDFKVKLGKPVVRC